MTDKQKHWQEILDNLDKTIDSMGLGLDENIKECVAGFIANGFNTTSSCGGHLDSEGDGYLLSPYVRINAEGEPENEFVGEKEIKQKLLEKYNIHCTFSMFQNDDVWNEYKQSVKNLTEKMEDWKAWLKKNEEFRDKAIPVIDEYNKQNGYEKPKIVLKDVYPVYHVEYYIDTPNHKDIKPEDKEMIRKNITDARVEFDKLTKFLKERYLKSK